MVEELAQHQPKKGGKLQNLHPSNHARFNTPGCFLSEGSQFLMATYSGSNMLHCENRMLQKGNELTWGTVEFMNR